MKEAKAKDVFVGELFFDNTTRKFYKRVDPPCQCGNEWLDHVAAVAMADGKKTCFFHSTKVVV